jgi:hypothetical protein
MSEAEPTATPPIPGPPAAPQAEPAHEVSEPKPTETVDFWKQKAREQEARAKSNADKAQAHDAYVESQKTEAQRLSDATQKAQREADEARAEATRYRVAATHGVSPDYFDLLGTGDEATITARAERLASLLSSTGEKEQLKAELEALKAGKNPALVRPVADLKPGATPQLEPIPDTSYPASWLPRPRQSNKT